MPLEMSQILESIRKIVGASHAERKVTERVRFCPVDGLSIPVENPIHCPHCGYGGDRALTFDPSLRFEIRDGRLRHWSVGAAVLCRFRHESEDRVLLMRRATYPVGLWTVASGHMDVSDSSPLLAVQREVAEETRLPVSHGSWVPVAEEELLEEGCRRGSDEHVWHFYRWECDPRHAEPTLPAGDAREGDIGEADALAWVRISEILARTLALTPPAAHFLWRMFGATLDHPLVK